MNCNTTHYRANSSSVPGDPTYSISQRDLDEGLRLHEIGDMGTVHEAWIERSGDISAVPRRKEPRVVEVAVEAGVQRIRIELG